MVASALRTKLKNAVRVVADRAGLEVIHKRDPYRLGVYERLHDTETLKRKPFINIGAGSFWHPYWTNVDYVSDSGWYAGVQRDVVHYDIMAKTPLPFATGSIEVGYTSHTIEHVKEDAVAHLFGEIHRVLRPGRVFRVTTGPDAESDYAALMRNDADWFYWDEAYVNPGAYEHIFHKPATSVPLAERWLHHVATALAPNDISPSKVKFRADAVLQMLAEKGLEGALDCFCRQCPFNAERPGNHVSWWTHAKVERYLREAGFEMVYRSAYRQSRSPLLRESDLFDSTHPQMSIYVEAVKTSSN